MRDKLIDLTDEGVFEFVYTDRHTLILFFLREEDNQLYRVTTDKSYEVEAIDHIETPDSFNGYSDLKFFKPYPTNMGGHVYSGVFKKGNIYYKFSIEDETLTVQGTFRYEDQADYDSKALGEFILTASVRKKDRLFFVGRDKESKDFLYGIINLERDIVERVYYLYSDEGEFIPKSITIDTTEQHVHIAGYQNLQGKHLPYFETFILPRN